MAQETTPKPANKGVSPKEIATQIKLLEEQEKTIGEQKEKLKTALLDIS